MYRAPGRASLRRISASVQGYPPGAVASLVARVLAHAATLSHNSDGDGDGGGDGGVMVIVVVTVVVMEVVMVMVAVMVIADKNH